MCTVARGQQSSCPSLSFASVCGQHRKGSGHKLVHGSTSLACAQSSDERNDGDVGIALLAGGALAVVVSAGFLFSSDIEALVWGDGLSGGLIPFGVGGLTASLLWSISLWFASPLQLLLLFLGAAIAAALDAGLGSATWGVSSGIATCLAAGVYELGRPERLSADQAVQLDGLYQMFVGFAERRLQRRGRCHESEIMKAFKADTPSFEGQEEYLRDMVSSWYPQAQRTPSGYYKNVSVLAKADAFTGKA